MRHPGRRFYGSRRDCVGLDRWRSHLDGEAATPLGAAAAQDLSSAYRPHPSSESMRPATPPIVGLVRPLQSPPPIQTAPRTNPPSTVIQHTAPAGRQSSLRSQPVVIRRVPPLAAIGAKGLPRPNPASPPINSHNLLSRCQLQNLPPTIKIPLDCPVAGARMPPLPGYVQNSTRECRHQRLTPKLRSQETLGWCGQCG